MSRDPEGHWNRATPWGTEKAALKAVRFVTNRTALPAWIETDEGPEKVYCSPPLPPSVRRQAFLVAASYRATALLPVLTSSTYSASGWSRG